MPVEVESSVRHLGCPCGCLNGVDCITERPAPSVVNDGCHCGPLGLDGMAYAAKHRLTCAPGRCVYRLLRGGSEEAA